MLSLLWLYKVKFSTTILNAVPHAAIPLSSLIILTTLSLASPFSRLLTSPTMPSNPTHCDSTISTTVPTQSRSNKDLREPTRDFSFLNTLHKSPYPRKHHLFIPSRKPTLHRQQRPQPTNQAVPPRLNTRCRWRRRNPKRRDTRRSSFILHDKFRRGIVPVMQYRSRLMRHRHTNTTVRKLKKESRQRIQKKVL